MRLTHENEILDEAFRKRVLDELRGSENIARKNEHLKRYEVYKDKTSKYVAESLAKEGLLPETVAQMMNRAGNISLARKIVNKLARAYSGGVQRTATPTASQAAVDELSRLMNFDAKMKKGDRYRELQRNTMLQIVPEIDSEHSTPEKPVYKLKLAVLQPWRYDVIEDCYDKEVPKVVIISNFDQAAAAQPASENKAGVHPGKTSSVVPFTNRKDDIIADAPQDAGMGAQQEFIWWSTNYHFTTNDKGAIVDVGTKTPTDLANPISMLPLVNNADEQDGQFWAEGGNDLIDGSVLVNKLITDMNYTAYHQGFGQLVVTGKDVTKERFRLGVNNALVLEYDPSKEEPKPTVDIISANPPIEAWMRMIEQDVALLLTTNNLSPSNVAGSLSASTFPSGIAMLVEQSEATDDITDKQADYKDIERRLWEITKRWQNLLAAAQALSESFAAVKSLPEAFEVSIKFHESKPVTTEAERLANIKLRKELGLNTRAELLQIDNPDLTDEEAEAQLKKIDDENAARAPKVTPPAEPKEDAEEEDEEDNPDGGTGDDEPVIGEPGTDG